MKPASLFCSSYNEVISFSSFLRFFFVFLFLAPISSLDCVRGALLTNIVNVNICPSVMLLHVSVSPDC